MPEDKLIKNVIIARSGIYQYRAEELQNLGLNIKDAPERKDVYNVLRPGLVLSNDKDQFIMMPLTNEHPDNLVDSKNFKQLIIGYTGENVIEEWNDEAKEIVLKTKVALFDEQALENYYTGINEVSPGYLAEFIWQSGKTENGNEYDIVMKKITKGNHLAMTPKARGGKVACIIDSEGGKMVINKYLSSLWRHIRKKKAGVKDSDAGGFRVVCEELATKKATLSDEDIKNKIDQLKAMAADLPESDDKNILLKYLEDFGMIKSQDDESAKMAADKVAMLYEKLDTQSMEGEDMGNEMNTQTTPADTSMSTGTSTAPATSTVNKDSVTLEYVAEELVKLAQAIKSGIARGQQNSTTAPATKPAGDEFPKKEPEKKPEENKEPEKKEPSKDSKEPEKKPEENKEPENKGVGDSFNNVVIDSQTSGKEGINDFFKNKVKKGGK